MSTTQGTINVQTENIFPIIKKFLYSDHEIFLRELVSNAVDACQKVKTLSSLGELKNGEGPFRVEVINDPKAKTLTIRDNGIGMTAEEVDKYINQIAFSGAEEFVEKYKDKDATNAIIGHFGLGFYSAFMVADKVEIQSLSRTEGSKAVVWECDGSPNFEMNEGKKTTIGTDIILHISEESKEFNEDARVSGILNKYCKFLPVEIKFGENTRTEKEKDAEGKEIEGGTETQITEDNIVNNPNPAWTKAPKDLSDEEYTNFYRELYPMNFDDPIFHIHLNVDFPFNLTGILYFPKLKDSVEVQKNKINLYSNQVFITDNVENIVPDFLTLLHGVIDSPDIPLNVSRSYLQEDGNVKKISSHITKKVASKLESMYKNNREDFESKWDDIRIFMEYGMLSEDKFYDKMEKIALYKSVDGNYFTFEEYKEKIKDAQTDKDGTTIVLYTNDKEGHHALLASAKERGYDVILLEGPLVSHLMSKLESKNEKVRFARIDSDTIDSLIKKDDEMPSKLTEEDQKKLQPTIEEIIDKEKFSIRFESMSETDSPILITQNEFMRRMKEQQAAGGGGMQMFGAMPERYDMVVNSNHPVVVKFSEMRKSKKKTDLISQTVDLALLAQGMLTGEKLTAFVKRSLEIIEE